MKILEPRDMRRVWARAKDLFQPTSWSVPESVQGWRVDNPLPRELRLTNNREAISGVRKGVIYARTSTNISGGRRTSLQAGCLGSADIRGRRWR
jgi:hypothetical protein